ncbi:hypothetical protein CYMTET_10562 [Cymbomonas tetramitiformis]|uniref:Uncharacterized protein n=1 Tax=Cymbomonas tetramitiformis TaxID=36881 RepID=A0AAE0LDW3_9CHLO|nr:hypothetical protein CYMTET_10562 [Cymbomonas tetramitiformis]
MDQTLEYLTDSFSNLFSPRNETKPKDCLEEELPLDEDIAGSDTSASSAVYLLGTEFYEKDVYHKDDFLRLVFTFEDILSAKSKIHEVLWYRVLELEERLEIFWDDTPRTPPRTETPHIRQEKEQFKQDKAHFRHRAKSIGFLPPELNQPRKSLLSSRNSLLLTDSDHADSVPLPPSDHRQRDSALEGNQDAIKRRMSWHPDTFTGSTLREQERRAGATTEEVQLPWLQLATATMAAESDAISTSASELGDVDEPPVANRELQFATEQQGLFPSSTSAEGDTDLRSTTFGQEHTLRVSLSSTSAEDARDLHSNCESSNEGVLRWLSSATSAKDNTDLPSAESNVNIPSTSEPGSEEALPSSSIIKLNLLVADEFENDGALRVSLSVTSAQADSKLPSASEHGTEEAQPAASIATLAEGSAYVPSSTHSTHKETLTEENVDVGEGTMMSEGLPLPANWQADTNEGAGVGKGLLDEEVTQGEYHTSQMSSVTENINALGTQSDVMALKQLLGTWAKRSAMVGDAGEGSLEHLHRAEASAVADQALNLWIRRYQKSS